MSKSVKRKISVELPKQKDLSKNRPSVFQRLGTKTKKLKLLSSSSETKTKTDVKIAKLSGSTSGLTNSNKLIDHHHRNLHDNDGLDDADQDLLEKRRAEIQKELELQSKMESSGAAGMRKQMVSKEMLRKRKRARSSSSSTSSSSDSGSSSDSSSSSSSRDSRRKMRKPKSHKRRQSSDSSTDGRGGVKKVIKVKRLCAKKSEANKKAIQARKLQIATGKLRKRSQSPTAVVVRKLPGKMVQKIQLAKSKVAASTSGGSSGSGISPEKLAKMQRIKEHQQQIIQRDMVLKERERMRLLELRDRERERLRMKEKERIRSRSPRTIPMKSRSPRPRSRGPEVRYRTTPTRRSTPPRRPSPPPPRQLSTSQTRSGSSMVRRDRSIERTFVRKDMYDKRQDSRERERRDKERQEREAAREKERHEALARCQERQRERERLAKERARQERDEERLKIGDRLIPRPAERALAIAAARDRSRDKDNDDRDRPQSHTRSIRDRLDRDKDSLAYERNEARLYDSRADRARMEKDDGRPLVRDAERERQRERDYVIVNRRDDHHIVGGRQPPSPYPPNRNPRDEREGPVNREFYVGDSRYGDRDVREGRRVPGQHEYGGNRVFADERHRPSDRDREWIRENVVNAPNRDPDRAHLYERPNERHGLRPEYDRSDVPGHPRGNYNDHRDWNSGPPVVGGVIGTGVGGIGGNIGGGNVGGGGRIGGLPPNDRKWDGGGNWPPPERDGPDNWDGGMYNEPPEWQDHHRMIDKGLEHPPGLPPTMNRRWINWRGGIGGGRGRGQHMPGGYGRGMPPIQDPNNIGYDDHFKRNIHPIVPSQPGTPSEFITQASRYQLINKPIEIVPVVAVVPPLINEPENVVVDTIIECKIEKPVSPAKELVNLEVTNPVIVMGTIAAAVISPTVVNTLETISSVTNAVIITPTNTEDANVTVKTEETTTTTFVESEIENIKLDVKVEPSEPLENSLTAIKSSAISETNNNEDADGEEQIQPDDLSEISDDADEILNQQEELQEKISDSVNIINQSDTTNVLGVNQQNIVTVPTDLSLCSTDKTSISTDPVNAQSTDASIEPIPNGQTNSMAVDPAKTSITDLNETKDLIVKDLHDDIELDFEEISDGELEEEARIKGLGDALGVDWASLVAESKAAHDNQYNLNSITTAKQRWAPHRILLDVGISFEMAGEQFAKRTLLKAYEQLKQEQSQIDSNNIKTAAAAVAKSEAHSNDINKIKIESTMQPPPPSSSVSVDEQNAIIDEKLPGAPIKMKIKEEILDDDDTAAAAAAAANENEKHNIEKIKNDNDLNTINNISVTKMNLNDCGGDAGTGNQLKLPIENELDIIMTTKLHPSACIQVANRLDIEKRKNLILNAAGPFSRALSARRDLQLRRQLCGLPIKEINSKLTTGNRTNLIGNSSANKDNNDAHLGNNNKQTLMNKNSNKYASMALKLFRKAIEPVV